MAERIAPFQAPVGRGDEAVNEDQFDQALRLPAATASSPAPHVGDS